jgi:hypothetical protein
LFVLMENAAQLATLRCGTYTKYVAQLSTYLSPVWNTSPPRG